MKTYITLQCSTHCKPNIQFQIISFIIYKSWQTELEWEDKVITLHWPETISMFFFSKFATCMIRNIILIIIKSILVGKFLTLWWSIRLSCSICSMPRRMYFAHERSSNWVMFKLFLSACWLHTSFLYWLWVSSLIVVCVCIVWMFYVLLCLTDWI